jgi:hypothetical protein
MTTERGPRPTTYYALVFDGVDYELNAYREHGVWIGQWRCGDGAGAIVAHGQTGLRATERGALAGAFSELLHFHLADLPAQLAARSTAIASPDLSHDDEERPNGEM